MIVATQIAHVAYYCIAADARQPEPAVMPVFAAAGGGGDGARLFLRFILFLCGRARPSEVTAPSPARSLFSNHQHSRFAVVASSHVDVAPRNGAMVRFR